MIVENMESATGNKVANQFLMYNLSSHDFSDIEQDLVKKDILHEIEGTVFQSYSKVIAFKGAGYVYLDETYWNYSVTTGKYRNDFLGETIKETRKKIKAGKYILVNLNN